MKRSFGIWLVAVFITSIVLPLALLSLVLVTFFNQMFERETDRLFMTTLHSVSQNITTYVNDLSRISMMPYYHAELVTYLHYMNNGLYATDPVAAWRVNKHYRLSISQQLDTSRSDVVGVLFVPVSEQGEAGYLVQRYANSLQVLSRLGAADSDWYQGTLRAEGRVFFSASEPNYYASPNRAYFSTDEDHATFSVARLIKDPDTMRPIGIMKVDAVDTVIREIFRSIPTDPLSTVMLLDNDHTVIYSNNGMEHLAGLLQGEDRQVVSNQNDTYRVSIAPIQSTPWKLCYFASEREAKERTQRIVLITALFGVLCFIAAAALFYGSSRKTVRSMAEILSALQRVACGDLDVHLPVHGDSYLATIAQALNQTTSRLESHIQREYRAVLSQRNAQYLALQSQINPHFLNNVLSGFVTLNQVGDRQTLERSILQLSHLFGYISKNEDMSTVGRELGFLREYLSLQKMRFGERLQYRLLSDPEADKVEIPKLLLQPLVENAIIHGMEPYDFDLLVEVLANIVHRPPLPPLLVVVVQDTGGGFDPEQIGANSTGLGNIQERLAIFSPASMFQIRSAPGKGCRIALLLSLQQKEDADADSIV